MELLSAVVPTFNEENVIEDCINSLIAQKHISLEVIVVDDGSSDSTVKIVEKFINVNKSKTAVKIVKQSHVGPGVARNVGARLSRGKILIFVDADMTFDEEFVSDLTEPIIQGKTIGTFSQNEILANPKNYWAKYWNMGRFASADVFTKNYLKSMIPNPKNKGGIFRAILKTKFDEVGGFEKSGDYSDDESLVLKIGIRAKLVKGSAFYHKNPSSLLEVLHRASWIGSGRNFTNGLRRKIRNLISFSLPISCLKAIIIGARFRDPLFVPFKIIYDMAVWTAIIKSL